MTHFDGVTYDPARDGSRLGLQMALVRGIMLRGGWWTLSTLAATVGAPEASVSARLRDLRKEKFGGHEVERRYVSKGLWEYRVRQPRLL